MGKTNWIEHTPKYREKVKGKRNEKVCKAEEGDIDKGNSYYRPCYRVRRDDNNLKESAREGRYKYQYYVLGFKRYGEQVCDKCWKLYDHKS